METVVVFAGAGASKAVAPESYPTTEEFFNKLPGRVTKDRIFKEVLSFLSHDLGPDAVIDIEVILWRLDELNHLLKKLSNKNDVGGWFVDQARLAKAIGKPNEGFGNIVQHAQQGLQQIQVLIDAINEQVYDLYSTIPEVKQLKATWLCLLEPLLISGTRVELVTTNYDLVLETAIDEVNKRDSVRIDSGWTGSIERLLDVSLWNQQPVENEQGLLTKLHGSVNWSRGGGKIYISDSMYNTNLH